MKSLQLAPPGGGFRLVSRKGSLRTGIPPSMLYLFRSKGRVGMVECLASLVLVDVPGFRSCLRSPSMNKTLAVRNTSRAAVREGWVQRPRLLRSLQAAGHHVQQRACPESSRWGHVQLTPPRSREHEDSERWMGCGGDSDRKVSNHQT